MSVSEALKLGALDLKRTYNRNLTIAFLIASGLVILLLSIPRVIDAIEAEDEVVEVATGPVTLTDIVEDIPEEDVPPPPPPPMIPPEMQVSDAGGTGLKEVAGRFEAVEDALVDPDLKIADLSKMSIAMPQGGDGGIGDGLGEGINMPDMNVKDLDFGGKKEEPAPPQDDEFQKVEKEPSFSLQEIQNNVEYPPLARENGIEGTVRVKVKIGKKGEVLEAKALGSPNGLLAKAATDAIRRSTFTPAIQNGNPVTFTLTIPVKFTLSDG